MKKAIANDKAIERERRIQKRIARPQIDLLADDCVSELVFARHHLWDAEFEDAKNCFGAVHLNLVRIATLLDDLAKP